MCPTSLLSENYKSNFRTLTKMENVETCCRNRHIHFIGIVIFPLFQKTVGLESLPLYESTTYALHGD